MIHKEYIAERDLGNGLFAWVAPQLFGAALLIIGRDDNLVYYDWCKRFDSRLEALKALSSLDPNNLPTKGQ